MASCKISGEFSCEDLKKLRWPIAWNGAPDLEYEASRRELADDAEEALRSDLDAVAVEIVNGEVVSTIHLDDEDGE